VESRDKTVREILANRPDIITKNMKDKIFLLTDVEIPSDRNVTKKESEKKSKYKHLSIEFSECGKLNVLSTGNHWSHRNCNYRTKKISGNIIRKALNRFSTKKKKKQLF
jgi:hypothetical protein